MTVDIICADAREALAAMPEGSVQTCITSPPYWGLRDYGLEPTVWGDDGCEHEWVSETRPGMSGGHGDASPLQAKRIDPMFGAVTSAFCRRCGAWRGTLGLEPTPELYVEHLVAVMREVRRVLRDDGTLWLNLGDSYSSGGRDYRDPGKRLNSDGRLDGLERKGARPPTPDGLKPKDLVGVPWRVAFALQADGWYLRSDIIWSKPNPMPESVTDRPTRAHEYLFLLSKSARYAYDADAIREPHSREWASESVGPGYMEPWQGRNDGGKRQGTEQHSAGRNKRTVWEIATQPYKDAHFATFPEKLVEPCILAGTSERGCCPECSAPWERVVEIERHKHPKQPGKGKGRRLEVQTGGIDTSCFTSGLVPTTTTTGWHPTCDCLTMDEARTMVVPEPVPCRVLDPFAGSGTVGMVAERLGRHSVLIDAKEEYCDMARARTAQRGLMI